MLVLSTFVRRSDDRLALHKFGLVWFILRNLDTHGHITPLQTLLEVALAQACIPGLFDDYRQSMHHYHDACPSVLSLVTLASDW